MQNLTLVTSLAMCLAVTASAMGQNVRSYDTVPNPYLFLLREPSVLEALSMTDTQHEELAKLNAEIDGPLLASRNQRPEKSQKTVAELFTKTQSGVEKILDESQRERLLQIMLRVRGMPSILTPIVAERIGLTKNQSEAIGVTVKATAEKVADIRSQVQNGETTQEKGMQQGMKARREQQLAILEQLEPEQQQKLKAVYGKPFDTKNLGQVSFKAPEMAKAEAWINSSPLRLADLKGQVIALHYFAFA